MYTAELFAMANDPKAVKEVFLNNVTLSIEDDAPGCIDLDAEKERLSTIWDLAHLPMRELVARTGLVADCFCKAGGVPLRLCRTGAAKSARAPHTSDSCWPSTSGCCEAAAMTKISPGDRFGHWTGAGPLKGAALLLHLPL